MIAAYPTLPFVARAAGLGDAAGYQTAQTTVFNSRYSSSYTTPHLHLVHCILHGSLRANRRLPQHYRLSPRRQAGRHQHTHTHRERGREQEGVQLSTYLHHAATWNPRGHPCRQLVREPARGIVTPARRLPRTGAHGDRWQAAARPQVQGHHSSVSASLATLPP